MLNALIIAGSFWLLFNLFLFVCLDVEGSRELYRTTMANFRAAVRGGWRA